MRHVQERTLNPITLPDDGCERSPSCLSCPLPVCKYDEQPLKQHVSRNDRIRKMRKKGAPVDGVAAAFGISVRSVHRILTQPDVPPRSVKIPNGPALKSLEDLHLRPLIRPRRALPTLIGTARD